MRIFVSEFITCGALAGTSLPDSLLREGRAMLVALAKGLRDVPDCQVVITLDRRQSDCIAQLDQSVDRFQVELINDAPDEQYAFDRLVVESDATLVIAPETDGVLRGRVQQVLSHGARSLNCRPEAIELCGDKLRLAGHLDVNGIPTIRTQAADLQVEPWDQFQSPCVLKLRDGAGSSLTFLIPYLDSASWQHAANEFLAAGPGDRAIVQPWISGQTLSVAALCHDSGGIELFPVARQHLEQPFFQYQGGSIPADLADKDVRKVYELVRATCQSIPGLRGYVGFDVMLPDDAPADPVIVEINPRLTTSFVGYQQLCQDNIVAAMLALPGDCEPKSVPQLRWKPGSIHFRADGATCYEAAADH